MKYLLKAYLLCVGLTFTLLSLEAQSYKAQYERCSQSLKNLPWEDTSYMYKVYERDECLIGAFAPKFNGRTIEGEKIALRKLKGNVVVINFWSISCVPCIREMPELNKIVKLYEDSNVVFLSVSQNTVQQLKSFFASTTFDFITIPDKKNILEDIFKLPGVVPYTVVLDRHNKISKMWFGSVGDKTFHYYQDSIEEALKR